MNLLFLPPEGIQVEKRLWMKRTGQFHTQVGPAHIGTNGHMRGGRSFMAPLNPATIDPLSGANVNMKGCNFSRDGDLQGLRNGQRGSLLCCTPPQQETPGALGQHVQALGGGLAMVAVAACQCLLVGGRATVEDVQDKTY